MAFAGGAVVFPGGRVDPGDQALAARFPALDADDAAPRIAAIRETIEEAGISVGLSNDTFLEAIRLALHQGATFGDLLDDARVTLDLGALVPFARWCPNLRETRTFDTRFYLARVDADHAEARVDATENVHLFWATAADVLARADVGDLKIIFPTRRNLERLAGFADWDAAVADALAHPVTTITPWIEERDRIRHLCIPEDCGYPVTSQVLDEALRS